MSTPEKDEAYDPTAPVERRDCTDEYLENMEVLEVERTVAIVKPDMMVHLEQVKERLIEEGFHVVQSRSVHLSSEQAADFYQEDNGKSFFPSLVSYMSTGPCHVFVLAKENCIAEWNQVIGPKDPAKARKDAPESLRAKYGKDKSCNAFHGSESQISFERDLHFFFPTCPLDPLPLDDAKEYLAKFINPILRKGLIEVMRAKPRDPITFLADYLDMNNPAVACPDYLVGKSGNVATDRAILAQYGYLLDAKGEKAAVAPRSSSESTSDA